MSGSIEDRINSTIDQIDGADATQQGQDTEGGRQDSGQDAGGGQQQVNGAAGPPADDQSGAQHPGGRPPAQGKEQQGRPRPADDRGLVEQQHLSRTQRAVQRETQALRTELDSARRDLQTFREAAQLPTQLGLTPQDTTTALQFMAHWRKDPVGAARNILTELKAAGYDVGELAGGVDVGAIQRIIRQEIAPFQQDRTQQYEAQQRQEAVQQEINDLYADMPWAQQQQNELASLLNADHTLSLREAAYQLQVWALQRGYDISQPLAPQHLAAGQGQPQQQPQRPNTARVPGPTANGEGSPMVPRQGNSLDHNLRTRDIVRAAMREAGMTV